MVYQQYIRLLNRNHLNHDSLLRNAHCHHLVAVRGAAVSLADEAFPSKLDFFPCKPMLERMLVHNDFDHRYLLSLNEIILQGERLGNSHQQVLPR